MPLKDRFRRALKRSDRSSSGSNSSDSTSQNTPVPSHPATGTSTPHALSTTPTSTTPSITLTKTNTSTTSRLGLSKTLTWGRKLSPEEKEAKRIEEWRKHDEKAWDAPPMRPNGRKSKAHQDVLRAFELNFKNARRSLSDSMFSGISPGQSRVGSVDHSMSPRTSMARKRSSVAGGLSREINQEDVEVVRPRGVGSVAEE